ncbi:uncharacterized protein SPPG_00300 [Spizellomyces punctatus DAOM BR117]|uniref:Transcriptional coactivator p15 (PC4) C-terminal domain-containing protein n=1 Tax=Spizellomyces punctatus (strain DAOM BR117) TaxID=645134 RepID=A0A0L0HUM5_SPIPD|nr:uncharacterized protein SPPG_00300 [Spizellomyces punctatus DAOM BR117]KND04580.1 hypothetical protein SPPG_00300 [Spizellomyces punctatus DAOM BR117]|eukprot:XP_016612619.1 hypothetical protein SPPG_00300 [Spizellomyces punctatus DAOM BR117]
MKRKTKSAKYVEDSEEDVFDAYDDEDLDGGDSAEEVAPKKKVKAAAQQGATKVKDPTKQSKEGENDSKTGKDGEYVLPLDGKKKLTVQKFKNLTLIGIREFYTDKNDGKEKPGKKGIAISPAAWTTLKSHIADIDEAISKLES